MSKHSVQNRRGSTFGRTYSIDDNILDAWASKKHCYLFHYRKP